LKEFRHVSQQRADIFNFFYDGECSINYYIWLIINKINKQCVLTVPAARNHFYRQVTQRFRRKLPTADSVHNQPALWTHKINSSASACFIVAWSLEICLWMSESPTELTSCGANIEHPVGHSILLFFSVATKRVSISGQHLDSYQRIRCRGNVFYTELVSRSTSIETCVNSLQREQVFASPLSSNRRLCCAAHFRFSGVISQYSWRSFSSTVVVAVSATINPSWYELYLKIYYLPHRNHYIYKRKPAV
jgi:hypothetical protein